MKRSNIMHRAVIESLEHRRLLSLTAPVYSSVGTHPEAVATGDFNGDGRSDVVTANRDSNDVSVLLSNASGALQPAQNFATGAVPHSVAVGDVSGDGKRDVVTANDFNVSVLLGNGNGTLQTAQNLTLPTRFPPGYTGTEPLPQTPQSVVVGDLNADGKLDLVVKGITGFVDSYISPYGGTVYFGVFHEHVNVLIGHGGGSFAAANTYTLPNASDNIALGDFNGDNKLDVVATTSPVSFLAGNGNGTLQAPVTSGSSGTGRPIVGDFDTDGKLDLITQSGSLYFIKGMGNGTFAAVQNVPIIGYVRSVVAGDMNADGKLDLVAYTHQTTFESYGYYGGYNPTTTEATKVLLGFGDGMFSRGVSSAIRSYPELSMPYSAASALGDFNADGQLDVVTTDPRNTNKVFVQLDQPGWIVPGTVRISDAAAVTEGNSGTANALFTVTLDNPPSPAATVSVNYDVDGDTAIQGEDFVDASGTITFSPGQTTKTITVQVKGDRTGENDEDFVVRLTNSSNAEITDDRALGTIIDDEPRVLITGGSVVEGNSGTTPLTFTVNLSAASDAPVTVNYQTADNTAVSATDYVAATSSVTFSAGQTTQTFTIAVKGDLVPEYQETFYVNLTGSSGALIIGNSAPGTINDTDPDPSVSIANVTRAEGNSFQTTFEFVLTPSFRSEKVISVHYATASGSATSSGSTKDFNADSFSANIYPNHITGSVIIYVLGDTRNESDETFFVNLTNPSGATIADNQAVGTILDDESRGKTWVGPASGGSWSTASNWSPSGVPTANSLVSITGASITISSSVTVAEISLIDNAALTVAPNGNRVLRTSGFFFGYYPRLDLNDNDLIVDYTAAAGNISPLGVRNPYNYTGIAGMLETGRARENGWGIVTTRPDALHGLTTLGVAEASQVLGLSGAQTGLFSGQMVDATTVLVRYTYAGDPTLDGKIDVDDYVRIDSNVPLGTGGWFNGDFNYDGKINIDDYVIIDSNIGIQGPPLSAASQTNQPHVAFQKADALGNALPPLRQKISDVPRDRPVDDWS